MNNPPSYQEATRPAEKPPEYEKVCLIPNQESERPDAKDDALTVTPSAPPLSIPDQEPEPPIIDNLASSDAKDDAPTVTPSAPPLSIPDQEPLVPPAINDMPPPLPARHLSSPSAPVDAKQKEPFQSPSQEGMLSQIAPRDDFPVDRKSGFNHGAKLIFPSDLMRPRSITHRARLNFFSYASKIAEKLDGCDCFVDPRCPGEHSRFADIWGFVFSIKTVLIRGAFPTKVEMWFMETGLGRYYRPSKKMASFTIGNPDLEYDFLHWREVEREIETDKGLIKVQHLASNVFDDSKKIEAIIHDTVEKILVNLKVLPPKELIAVLENVKDKLIEAIECAAENTSDAQKAADLRGYREILNNTQGNKLTYDEFNDRVHRFRVTFQGAIDTANKHRVPFSFFKKTRSFNASESLFKEADSLLMVCEKAGADSSSEVGVDSKTLDL